jgi:predicted nucleic acid-binding Zn ribbon protein
VATLPAMSRVLGTGGPSTIGASIHPDRPRLPEKASILKTLLCPICGTFRAGVKRSQQTCSSRCGQMLLTQRRGSEWRKGVMQKAARAGAAVANKAKHDRWRAQWPDVPLPALRVVHKSAYDSGFNAGARSSSAFARGYEKALKDMAR